MVLDWGAGGLDQRGQSRQVISNHVPFACFECLLMQALVRRPDQYACDLRVSALMAT